MIRRLIRVVRSLVVLVALVAGVPWALVRWVGSPIPARVPGLGETIDSIERSGVEPRTMVWCLALVVWIAWLRLTVALFVEVIGIVVRRPVPNIRMLGSSQRLAASLLTSMVLIAGTLGASRGAMAATGSTGTAEWRAGGALPSLVVEASDLLGAAPAAVPANPATWTVMRNDSLWRIAERALGDGTRWREVASVNLGREVAPGVVFAEPDQTIHPGWVLALPELPPQSAPAADAAAVELAAPAPASPPPTDLLAMTGAGDQPVGVCAPGVAPYVPDSAGFPIPDPEPAAAPGGFVPAQSAVPAASVAPVTDPSERSVVSLGLGAATLVATGGLGVLSARRRRNLRAAGAGARLVLPPAAELVDLERTLRAASADELMARLDLALRGAVAELVDRGSSARVLGAVVARDGSIGILLDAEVTPVPPMVAVASKQWLVPATLATPEIPSGPRFAPFPCPALVPVGLTADGELYLDLEAVGILAVEGSARHRRSVLRSCVAGITLSPLATGHRVVTVGFEPLVSAGAEVHPVADLDEAIEWAAAALSPLLGVLRPGEATSALRSRSAGEPWEPVIVVAAAERVPPAMGSELLALAVPGGRGLGIITDAPGIGATWKLRELDDTWRLEPLGIDVRPVGLSADQVGRLATLLAHADAPVPPSPANHQGGRDEISSFVDPPWHVLVQTLGPPGLRTADGLAIEVGRAKALELVVWMARHRSTATRSGARAALWESEVANGTFANIVSDARQSLGAALESPDGEPWVSRTLTEHLELHPLVLTDVELLAARLAHARRQAPSAARATLTEGLALVSGPPFAGAPYLWSDAEGWVSQDTLLITDAAAELAGLCLADGDLDGVMAATAVGLRALPGHEELVGLRLRAHAGRGDLAAVRREWESYERIVAADTFGDGEPSPRLLELRHELLVTRRRVG